MNISIPDTPIARSTLADSAYETLLEAIVSGTLRSGAVLTSVGVANQFHISRTPAQEALRRLTGDGLLEMPTGKRATVKKFTREDAIEIYEMRMLLEGECAARATIRIDQKDLAELRVQVEGLLKSEVNVDWCSRALQCDAWFHEQLAEASQSRRLCENIDRYRLLVRGFCRMIGTEKHLQDAAHEHLEIVSALEQRDPERARETMQRHIQLRLNVVLREVFQNTES